MHYRPTTRQVLVFLAVAEHLKLVRAAEVLNMSQPAVTAQLGQLEQNLGMMLFHRTKRDVVMTEAGRNILPAMRRIAEALDDILETTQDLGAGRRGRVQIAVLPSVAASLLPHALRRFMEDYPGIEVQLYDVVADEIMEMVKAGTVDFGIGLRLRADHDVIETQLLRDELRVFLPADHPLATRERISLADCAAYPQVVTKTGSSVRLLLERALVGAEAEITIALEANYMSTALAAVRAGLGLAILPETAREAGNAEGLVSRRLGDGGVPRDIMILSKRGRALSQAASLLAKMLGTEFREPEA